MRFSRLAFGFVSAALVACSSSDATSSFSAVPDSGPAAPGDDDGGSNGLVTPDGSFGPLPDGAAGVGKTLLYAHDGKTLYQIDPTDPKLSATSVGKFSCIGSGAGQASSMTDIALDATGGLYGVATDTLFLGMKIVAGGVDCGTAVAIDVGDAGAKAKFEGASFAPKGTLDPNKETLLVGDTLGEIYAVDTTTGALTIVGTFGDVPADDGNGNAYPSDSNGGTTLPFQMSGDIVFLANGGAPLGFATVRDCKSAGTCSHVDTLIELDVSKLAPGNTGSVRKSIRGQVRKAASCNDPNNDAYGSMYGIAAFEDKVIGFSHQGFIVSVDNADGTACLIHDYSGMPLILFDGAGVTTSAPVKAPPPK